MKQDFLKTFSPANAKNPLSGESLTALQSLTTEEINALAKEYPNQGTQMAYLVLRDTSKKAKDQLFPLSTWQNLADLHRLGQTHFVPEGFAGSFSREAAIKTPSAPVQDLTKSDLEKAPGLKKGAQQDLSKKGKDAAQDNATGEEEFEDLSGEAENLANEEGKKAAAKKGAAKKAAAKKGAAKKSGK